MKKAAEISRFVTVLLLLTVVFCCFFVSCESPSVDTEPPTSPISSASAVSAYTTEKADESAAVSSEEAESEAVSEPLPSDYPLTIDAAGGSFENPPTDGRYAPGEAVILPLDDGTLLREGYTPIGFSDGTKDYAFGTTILMPQKALSLRVRWVKDAEPEWFSTAPADDPAGLRILGFSRAGLTEAPAELNIPAKLNGMPVYTIAENAFAGCSFLRTVRLPVGLREIGANAFAGCDRLTGLMLPETLTVLAENAFRDCPSLADLRIHASLPRVFDVDYDSALADKYLRLKETEGDAKRIILVGGSGLSFGIECDILKDAFPDCTILNFSTSVYYGIRPLLGYLQNSVHEGDILLFCLEHHKAYMFGEETPEMTNWQYLESCYDMLADLDLRENTILLRSYPKYLQKKREYLQKGKKKYNSPIYSRSSFDRDGDLDIYREAQVKDFGTGWPKLSSLTDTGLAYLHDAMEKLRKAGAVCLLTYPATACREGISKKEIIQNTAAFARKLEAALSDVCTPITKIEDSYLPESWFHDSMFHMSSDGAAKRTALLRENLIRQFNK